MISNNMLHKIRWVTKSKYVLKVHTYIDLPAYPRP